MYLFVLFLSTIKLGGMEGLYCEAFDRFLVTNKTIYIQKNNNDGCI